MQKLLAKLLVFLMIFQIISPISIIGQVFAVSNTWDFSNSSDYTLSDTDTNHIRIENSLVRLPYHLEHLGAISDTSLDGARRVIVKGDYAFVSAYDADTVLSVDISDPTNPVIVSSIANIDGPTGLAISGDYLYVAGYLSDNINIIDISDPTNITFVKEIEDSRWDQQLNGVKDIQVFGDHLYATAYNDDAFNIFDNSDPTDPQFLEDLKDSSKLDGINRAKIDGTYAYVSVDKNDSFAVIDLTNQDDQFQNISIVGEVNNGDDGALLDGARGLSFSGNIAYVAATVSDSLELIDISDPTNPVHTGTLVDGGDIELNANRQVIFYNNFTFNSARTSDAIEVVDVSNPTNPVHESNIMASSEVLLDGANDIYNVDSIFYVASNVGDALEILKVKYSDNSPYVIPNNPYNYTGAIDSFSEILGANNQGNITYQISYDAGNTWYYFDGSSWQETTAGVSESNSASIINDNLYGFNKLNGAGTGEFLFKAFLNSDGIQKVELDKVNITTIENAAEIANPVFWFDGQDVDGDGDSSNDPSSGDEVSTFVDKFNSYNAYNTTSGEIPTFDDSSINGYTNLNFDGDNDYYEIDNQDAINTSTYYEKSFSMVFKTGDDITTFQNVYEQGGDARGYVVQIENQKLYAGVFNNIEWDDGDQYKFVSIDIKENQTYYLTMIHDSINSNTLRVYLDANIIGELNNLDYQRAHAGSIGLGFVNGNIRKASDYSTTSGPAYFKGNIGEFISWNHVLTDNERVGIDMYLKNKWDLDFKIYPIITYSSLANEELIQKTDNYSFSFNYEDGVGGNGIDTNLISIELYKWDVNNSVWGSDIASSGIVADNIGESSSSYHFTDLIDGKYKILFTIGNIDGNTVSKEVIFDVDIIGVPEKVYHFDAQNIDGDFDNSNEPSDATLISRWNDIENNSDATESTSDYEAIYKINTINNHPSLNFDGLDDYYGIANEEDINTSTFKMKSFSMILKTGDDVTNFQNVYEQGGGARGYGIQIENGHLYMGAWNNVERDDGYEYMFVDLGEINTNEIYNILLVQDSIAGVDDEDVISAYIDGRLAGKIDHVDKQYSHPGNIVLGKNHDGRKYDGGDPDDGYYFKGNIGEFISWNYSLTGSDIDNLNNYLVDRWSLDKVAPVVSFTNIASGSILPGGNHSLEFSYSDTSEYGTGVGIDISSDNIILERYNSSNNLWEDYSNQIGTGTITETKASYPSLNLDYGKYRVKFSISDNNGNTSEVFENTFYIDRPSLVVSTGSVNIGTLNDSANTFGDTLTITVKTIGAPFRVKLKKNQALTQQNSGDIIPYYDGTIGMGYDKNDDGNLSDFNDDIILSDSGTLNTDGELNTYTYTVKIGAIIDKLQVSGNYEGKVNFGIELDY